MGIFFDFFVERLGLFLPSLFAVAALAAVFWCYLWWIGRQFKKELGSVEYLRTHKMFLFWAVSLPSTLGFAPTAEEVLCRTLLIVLFPAVTGASWTGIILFAIGFGLAHYYFNEKYQAGILMGQEKFQGCSSDDLQAEAQRILVSRKEEIRRHLLFQGVAATVLGLLAGYFGVRYQSLWVSVLIHFGWNLFFVYLWSWLVYAVVVATVTVLEVTVIYRSWRFRRSRKFSRSRF